MAYSILMTENISMILDNVILSSSSALNLHDRVGSCEAFLHLTCLQL
jgi:hypothetical protein